MASLKFYLFDEIAFAKAGDKCKEISPLSNAVQKITEQRMRLFTSFSVVRAFRLQSRGFAVKKKPNYGDQPHKITKPILVKTLRGFQFTDGEDVFAGDILVRQLGMEFYPGENVKLNRENWDLVALCNGRFTISTEILSPYPDSPLYPLVQKGQQLRKPFVHVIADSLEPIFKHKRSL